MANRSETEKQIIQSLRLVFQAIQQHSSYVEKQLGVSSSQLWAMTELNEQSGLRVSDIAQRLGIKKATASNMLDKIQMKGLVERRRESGDQRVVRLFLTGKGKRLIRESSVPTQGAVLSALGLMPEKDVNQLNKALQYLIEKMLLHECHTANHPIDNVTGNLKI